MLRSTPRPALLRLIAAALPAVFAAGLAAQVVKGPPPTRRDDVKDVIHGTEIVDPYRWLEDGGSAETRSWIAAQNAFTDATLGALPGREAIRKRLTELMRLDTQGTPTERGGRYFFTRKAADQELSVIVVREGREGKDRVLVDPHPWSADGTMSASLMEVSEDGRLLAYGVRLGGQDEVEVRLLDVDTGKDRGDRLPRARYGSVEITPDGAGFYYSKYDTKAGPRLWWHVLGRDPAGDTLVFGEGVGPGKSINAALSEDGRWLLIHVAHGSAALKTEVWLQDRKADGPPKPLVNDLEATFAGRFGGDRIFLRTDWDAPNGRILAVDPGHPERERWKEVIPAGPAVIQGFAPAGGRIFVTTLENVVPRTRIHDAEGRPLGEIALPGPGSGGQVSGRWSKTETWYGFESVGRPPAIWRYDIAKNVSEPWWRAEVPYDGAAVAVRQVWFESKDKTRVPMFVAHRKDLKPGAHPAFLTGYGGFNQSRLPGWSSLAALWIERGGVWALPGLRGGGEFGEAWHKAGMVGRRQNVFDDFIAAAEWLIANGLTAPGRLAVAGGSNGGLLVGAALAQRPELFRAVVCSVPLLDMVRYHRFLVARFWVPEYGSAEDPEHFKFLHAYSPYHRLLPSTDYPSVLFVSGDGDTRVDPLHARKMCARLQAATASGRPVLLRYDTKAGHSGGKPLTKQIDDLAEELHYLLWQLDALPKEGAGG